METLGTVIFFVPPGAAALVAGQLVAMQIRDMFPIENWK